MKCLLREINLFIKLKMEKSYVMILHQKHINHYPAADAFIVMSNYQDKLVWKNASCRLYDLGDDVLGLQWFTKME